MGEGATRTGSHASMQVYLHSNNSHLARLTLKVVQVHDEIEICMQYNAKKITKKEKDTSMRTSAINKANLN